MTTPYRGRVRTGCLSCRAAKVKCDEQNPVCKRCLRHHKECVYPGKRDLTRSSPVREPRSNPSLSPSCTQALPSLLSTLVSQDIYLCTTIDYIAAIEGRHSFTYFLHHVDCPFITPYDPANWHTFKETVLETLSDSIHLAKAVEAVQAAHRSRRNALPHGQALDRYREAASAFEASMAVQGGVGNNLDIVFVCAFLLALVEMMLPQETAPGFFLAEPQSMRHEALITRLPSIALSPLTARLSAWLLICHAAARRSGNRGLLAPLAFDSLKVRFNRYATIQPLDAVTQVDSEQKLLTALTEPLFTFYVRTQIISAQVAELSHYHRSRVTGADQEEVATSMSTLKTELDSLWDNKPALMQHSADDLHLHFTSSTAAEALVLLCTLCALVYDTEMVEMARNLSQEQSTTPESCARLTQIQKDISTWTNRPADRPIHPAFLRALLLCAIEATDRCDSEWAVTQMRKIHDPICYSDFFANFAEGLADTQRQMGRRVTTRWVALQTFGIDLPFL